MYWCLLKCCDFFFFEYRAICHWYGKHVQTFWRRTRGALLTDKQCFYLFLCEGFKMKYMRGISALTGKMKHFYILILFWGKATLKEQCRCLFCSSRANSCTLMHPHTIRDTDNKPDGPSPSIFFKRKFTSHLSDTEHISTLPHSILNEH